MKSFLEFVAEDIIRKYGTDLSRTVVVFPNKRASLFLNEALARLAGKPLWSPVYITISELFRRQADCEVADPIKLVCDLYRSYVEVTGFDETLDHFYGWGQLLIADFDDIDKNMAPAAKVFANLRDVHELDDTSFLTEEQKAAVRKFFSNFTDDHDSLLKQRFLRLWSRLGDVYESFNRRLASQGLAYEGGLYRRVAEDGHAAFGHDRYLFVGFNLLQAVERRLFARLRDEGKAFFYWDFDHAYMHSEAGHFIARQLAEFPNELPDADDIYRNFRRPKDIDFVTAPTEDVQARYVAQWLAEKGRMEAGRRTAIVLCDEGLLQTVVHCLPEGVEHVNITTGYPLRQSPASSFVALLFALYQQGYDRQRQRFRRRDVERVRRHPYAAYMADDEGLLTRFVPDGDGGLAAHVAAVVRHVAANAKADAERSPLMGEALFRMYTLLNRLATLEASGDLTVDPATMQRLATQLVQQATIPFHGEPAVGLQVMGVLETRNLDFDHVLMLSCNEGNMPRGVADSSFIPYSIRRAYGLTTADHKVAIYAYYFHRLLSRASDVTIVASTADAGGQAAEMSRFMLQLMVEDTWHDTARHTLQTSQHARRQQPRAVEKTPEVIGKLRRRFDGAVLSPTAVNRYMRCPLQFYYCYAEGLREADDTDEDTIDGRAFGNIFHNAAQTVYERLAQRATRVTADALEELLKSRVDIERAVDEAFAREFDDPGATGGLGLINREVIVHYLRRLVEADRRNAPFTIIGLEKDVTQTVHVKSLGKTLTVGGRVDRLDGMESADGTRLVRVVDYKTGGGRVHPMKCVDDIFDPAQLENHSDYYLQTMLYARIVRRGAGCPTVPAVLSIQHAAATENPVLKLGDKEMADVANAEGDRFAALLEQKIDEMFDPSRPFVPTDDAARCATCPYAQICGL